MLKKFFNRLIKNNNLKKDEKILENTSDVQEETCITEEINILENDNKEIIDGEAATIIVEENLEDIVSNVDEIKTSENSSLYDYCEDPYVFRLNNQQIIASNLKLQEDMKKQDKVLLKKLGEIKEISDNIDVNKKISDLMKIIVDHGV